MCEASGTTLEAANKASRSFYNVGERVLVDEDGNHQFEMHRHLTIDNFSENYRENYTLQSISRHLCAFLNTAKGGTVYMGVQENGEVAGLLLTRDQKTHTELGLENILYLFEPLVPRHMYSVRFVPVLPEGVTTLPPQLQSPDVKGGDRESRHEFWNSKACWCDNEASAEICEGREVDKYVVEVEMHPWCRSDPRNEPIIESQCGLHPMFENEEHLCFVRRQCRNIMCSMQDVVQITIEEVKAYYSIRPKGRKLP